jgi:hypothetical protein
MQKGFASAWKQRLALPATGAWQTALWRRLEQVPFTNVVSVMPLFEFLLSELPKRIRQRPSQRYRDCAEAYGWFCLALTEGESIYLHYAENFARYLNAVLRDAGGDIQPAAEVIASLYRPDKPSSTRCGFNRLAPEGGETLRKAESIVADGAYEEFLTEQGRGKYDEYLKRLGDSPAFAQDWRLIKESFAAECNAPILRRSILPERNWQRGDGASFADPASAFQSVFDLFCWKWYLWGMAGDSPLLLKPSVNVTAHGTQIFIPGYLSLDPKRDIDFARINHLHRARGSVPKQGPAFAESREQFAERSKQAKAADKKGRRQGLKGTELNDFILSELKRPWADSRQLRRWLG